MSDTAAPRQHVILVGVVPDQPDDVLTQAMRFAHTLDADLVCASVTSAQPHTAERPSDALTVPTADGHSDIDALDPAFADHLIHLLSQTEARWTLRVCAGDPVHELTRIAAEIDAELIVVGTRHPGVRAGAREFFSGSVAVHLAHRQHRPVLVIPPAPSPHGTKLPWEEP